MKVAIIYPAKDYMAADISYKLKAFTEGKGLRVVISKKNNIVSSEVNFKRFTTLFKDVGVALFLMYDALEIDGFTKEEIIYLKSKNIPIYAIVPSIHTEAISFLKMNGVKNIYTYNHRDPQHFMSIIEKITNDIKKSSQISLASPQNNSNNVIGNLIALLGFIILILALFDFLKKK